MSTVEGRPAARYIQLIRELAEEIGGERWRSEAGRRLGVDSSYVSRLFDGERISVGNDAIERAISNMRINSQYFYGPIEPRSYRDYTGNEPPYKAWRDFLATDDGRAADPRHKAILASVDWPEGQSPTVRLYKLMLLNLQSELGSGIHRAVALERSLDEDED